MTKARDIASAIPAPSTVSSAELGYLDGVTSAIQTQIDTKAPSSTAVTLTGTQTLTNKTLTNPVIASVVNNTLTSTTGDMIYASAANTPARLGIGSSAQVLTVASGVPSWATPAAGGGMTLLDTLTMSGASVTSSSFSSAYKALKIYVKNFIGSNNSQFDLRMNADTGSNYTWVFYDNGFAAESPSSTALRIFNQTAQSTVLKATNAIIDIMTPSDTDQVFLTYTGIHSGTGTFMEQFLGQGMYDSSAAITSITLKCTGLATMTSGTAYIYGVN